MRTVTYTESRAKDKAVDDEVRVAACRYHYGR